MPRGRIGALALAALLFCLAGSAPASAQAPDFVLRIFNDRTTPGNGAGRLNFPIGVVADPGTGHMFVAELSNDRISEFTAWGEFVRSWGAGVATGAVQGSGDLTAGSTLVESVSSTVGTFQVGQSVSGPGIPAGAVIEGLGAGRMRLSEPATASGTAVALSVVEAAGNVPTDELQTMTLGGAPSGGSFTLTTTSGIVGGEVQIGSSEFRTSPTSAGGGVPRVGDRILPGVFPSGTTITAIDTTSGVLTLSAAAVNDFGENNLTATETTAPIPYNAPASGPGSVQEALEALPNVGAGGVSVSGPAGGPYEVTFEGPLLGDLDVAQMSADSAGLTPSGTVTVTTRRQGASAAERCVGSECKGGIAGSGAGQFSSPTALALDGGGDVYVFDNGNHRVQKFSPTGEFLLMFGGQVNKTKVEASAPAAEQNLCPVDPGDVCQAGTAGSAPGAFGTVSDDALEYDPVSSSILVGEEGKIQEFNLDGTVKGEIPFTGELAAFSGRTVSGLAVGPGGSIYMSVTGLSDVYKLSPAGVPLAPGLPGASQFTASDPSGLAVDHDGDLYVMAGGAVREFDPAANKLLPTPMEESIGALFPGLGPDIRALATDYCPGSAEPGSLYVALSRPSFTEYFVNLYGSPPFGCELPPANPPAIAETYATEVGVDSATLEANINPRFWDDTTYQVQWGASPCSSGGCTNLAPASPALLTGRVTSRLVRTGGVDLAGLQPATTYHYRFVAESSGGGPTVSPEKAFRTFATPEPKEPCGNDSFRVGPAADLPDCRAYEMVSPARKGGMDVLLRGGQGSAASGERFTYVSTRAFSGPASAADYSQYLAERGPNGWQSRSIAPPRTAEPVTTQFLLTEDPFDGFSADLCEAWIRPYSSSPLTADAVPGYANLYRRNVCTDGPYEALTTVKPPDRNPAAYVHLRVHGVSADGSRAIFVANGKLTADAPVLNANPSFEENSTLLLYYHRAGDPAPHFVCYLPNGTPNPTACAAGAPSGYNEGGSASATQGAISADGSRVFWTAYSGGLLDPVFGAKPGKLYVRINPEQPQSAVAGGHCTEPEKACTLAVSGSVTPEDAVFWAAAADGSRVLFRVDAGPLTDNLYSFDVDAALAGDPEPAHLIAHEALGPAAIGKDASRFYFASRADLDGGGPAQAGESNLYFHEDGAGERFVMALEGENSRPANEAHPQAVAEPPTARSSSLDADGRAIAFVSNAPPPSGYDNTVVASGESAEEVYRYDAATDKLACISCNPTGARPSDAIIEATPERVAVAGRLPVSRGYGRGSPLPRNTLYPLRPISADGRRVFFESFEALVPGDTNETWDVYQWEESGTGTCATTTPTYSPASGGCVELLSSGKDPQGAAFLDADADGKSVFISTRARLTAADTDDLRDVYAARVDGGFPASSPPPAPCEAESCRAGAPAAPATPGAGSAAFAGPGDPAPRFKAGCPRGRREVRRHGKARCLKPAHHHKRGGRR